MSSRPCTKTDILSILLISCGEFLSFCLRLLWRVLRCIMTSLLPRRPKNLAGEIVLVTGAARGIGKRTAALMAEMGAELVLWDVDEVGVQEAAQEIVANGGRAHWYACDVTSESSVLKTAQRVQEEVGVVGILVNNAGIMQNLPLKELSGEGIRRTLEVNLLAHFWTIRSFLPSMEKCNKGHIVAIASCAGLIGHINQTDYSASKHGVVGLMEALSEEIRLKGCKIKLTTVCPLTVNTGMNQNPVTKCSWLMPIIGVEEAARGVINAIRREDFLVTVPPYTNMALRLARLLPREVLCEFMDFTDYCRVKNSS